MLKFHSIQFAIQMQKTVKHFCGFRLDSNSIIINGWHRSEGNFFYTSINKSLNGETHRLIYRWCKSTISFLLRGFVCNIRDGERREWDEASKRKVKCLSFRCLFFLNVICHASSFSSVNIRLASLIERQIGKKFISPTLEFFFSAD